MKKKQTHQIAFTLAELLITIGIIGVVAMMVLPTLFNNVQNRVKEKRVDNIKHKLSKSIDNMAVNSGLIGYSSTEKFVNELQKYLKISKICSNENLSNCWPTDEVDLGEGFTWNISNTKKAKDLKVTGENWADTVAIITGDGTPMIISYNKNCKNDPTRNGFNYDYTNATSDSLNCVAAVFDWNGSSNPNAFGEDVLTLGSAGGLGKRCSYVSESGLCILGTPHKVTTITSEECNEIKDIYGFKLCMSPVDSWAGAVKECGGLDNMFSPEELAQIANEIYGTEVTVSGETVAEYNPENAQKLGFPATPPTGLMIWSNTPHPSIPAWATVRSFSSDKTSGHTDCWREAQGGRGYVLCKSNN